MARSSSGANAQTDLEDVTPLRPRALSLVLAGLLGTAFVALPQVHAAQQRERDERAAHAIAVSDRFRAQASAALEALQLPAQFAPAPLSYRDCMSTATRLCRSTSATPSIALSAAVAALHGEGLDLVRSRCLSAATMPPRLARRFGDTWAPCSARGRVGSLPRLVQALPVLDPTRSTRARTVFTGTSLRVIVLPPGTILSA